MERILVLDRPADPERSSQRPRLLVGRRTAGTPKRGRLFLCRRVLSGLYSDEFQHC